MIKSLKVLFISSVLLVTASCQDTLDTSSQKAKEQSIKQMMVGIYPQNQKIFKNALSTIYEVDRKTNSELTKDEVIALTNKKLNGKTVEDILRLSFLSKKIQNRRNRIINTPNETVSTVVATTETPKLNTLVKTNFEPQ